MVQSMIYEVYVCYNIGYINAYYGFDEKQYERVIQMYTRYGGRISSQKLGKLATTTYIEL